MKPSKRLTLSREALGELQPDDLRAVAGGWAPPTAINCPTIHRPCPSNPLTNCTVIHVTREETCIC